MLPHISKCYHHSQLLRPKLEFLCIFHILLLNPSTNLTDSAFKVTLLCHLHNCPPGQFSDISHQGHNCSPMNDSTAYFWLHSVKIRVSHPKYVRSMLFSYLLIEPSDGFFLRKKLLKYSWFRSCVNFSCMAEWLSYTWIYTCVCVYSLLHSFPLWLVTGYWLWFPLPCRRTLLLIHPMYHTLPLLVPISQPFLPLGTHKVLFSGSVSLLFHTQVHLCGYFRFHTWVASCVSLPFSFWLTSLSMVMSRSIHIAADGIASSFLMGG